MSHKSERYDKMIAVQKEKESKRYLEAALTLIEAINLFDREHGSMIQDTILSTRADVLALIRRRDLPVVQRRALVEIGVNNLCHLLNTASIAKRLGWQVSVVPEMDNTDWHYGKAMIAAAWHLADYRPEVRLSRIPAAERSSGRLRLPAVSQRRAAPNLRQRIAGATGKRPGTQRRAHT
jgi:hypothetical protein